MSAKPSIDKSLLKHLAELSRIKLTARESAQFLKDAKKILNYFEELTKVNVPHVEPVIGGSSLKNVFRDDKIDPHKKAYSVNDAGRIIEAFPEAEKGYLKVPKIL